MRLIVFREKQNLGLLEDKMLFQQKFLQDDRVGVGHVNESIHTHTNTLALAKSDD